MECGFPTFNAQAKAVDFKQGKTKLRDKILTSVDTVGQIAGIPVIVQTVNAANKILWHVGSWIQ